MNATLRLTFLGSGNAFTAGGRYWSGFLANGRYLFDAPPTLLPHLKRLGAAPAALRVVFLTHVHGDHFLGLPFLLLEYGYLTQRREDLVIIGPPGVQEVVEDLTERVFPGLAARQMGYRRLYVEAAPGQDQQAADVTFCALPMYHAPGKLNAYGYRVHIGGRAVAYTGDTMYCPEIAELARGADALVVDATYATAGPEHMGLEDVRRLRSQVDRTTAIVLTHLEAEPAIDPDEGLLVAHDFATFVFP
ncbi:MAG: MBL fold metallo-hydrolase [Dehalococcoidia bacterium]